MNDGKAPATLGVVRLRDVTEADLPAFFEHQLDPEANRMAAFPARDREAFMAHWARILRDPSLEARTVLLDEHVAGNVVSWGQSGEQLVGYWIGREYWGRGVATRALMAFLEHLRVRPLWARVAAHNVGSIRVLEKCGFTLCPGDTGHVEFEGDEVEELLFELRT